MDQQDGSASSWPNLAEDLDLDLDLNLDLDLCQPATSTVQRVITVPSSVTVSSLTTSSNAVNSSIVSSNNSTPVNSQQFVSVDNVAMVPCKSENRSPHETESLVDHTLNTDTQYCLSSSVDASSSIVDHAPPVTIEPSVKPTPVQITPTTNTGPITYMLPSNILSSLKSGKIQIQLPTSTSGGLNVTSTLNATALNQGQATLAHLKPSTSNAVHTKNTNFVPIAPASKSTTNVSLAPTKISIPGAKGTSSQVIMLPADVLSSFKGKIHIQVPQSGSTSSVSSSISTGGGSGTLSVTAINNSRAQVTSVNTATSTSGGKFVPIAPSPSIGKTNSTVATAQIVSSKPGQPQVIMLPSSIFSQMKNNKIQIQVPSSAITGTSGGSGTINITSLSTSGFKTTPSRATTNYVPIAPSPVTNCTGNNSTSNVTPRDLFGGFKGQSNGSTVSKAGILGVGASSLPDDANRQRKPCNCTKSQCLKLYCDCFANGEFCSQCNCSNCYNNLDHEDERQRAVRQCLERNPQAFHPKIGKGRSTGDITERRHTKGCNCRRSGCLKNYCECYEAKILCSELCKCCGCKNYEDSFERRSLQLMNPMDGDSKHGLQAAAKLTSWTNDFRPKLPIHVANQRFSHSFTQEVIEATSNCLMVTAEESERNNLNESASERALLTEFGQCLNQIIDWSNKSK